MIFLQYGYPELQTTETKRLTLQGLAGDKTEHKRKAANAAAFHDASALTDQRE
ncbi:hypothetical protein [Labrys miyagiensis]